MNHYERFAVLAFAQAGGSAFSAYRVLRVLQGKTGHDKREYEDVQEVLKHSLACGGEMIVTKHEANAMGETYFMLESADRSKVITEEFLALCSVDHAENLRKAMETLKARA